MAGGLSNAQKYYLEGDEAAYNDSDKTGIMTDRCAYTAGASFILAIVCSIIFVSFNLDEAEYMSERKTSLSGATVPSLQKMQPEPTLKKAQPVPSLQKIVPNQQTQPQQQPAQPQSTAQSEKTGK